MKSIMILFIMVFSLSCFANMTMNGSFTLGHEYTDYTNTTSITSNYFDLDLDINFDINSNYDLYISLITGGNNPRSNKQLFNNNSGSKDFGIGESYLTYTTKTDYFDDVKIKAGKFKNGIKTYDNFVWDKDIAFEGVSFETIKKWKGNKVNFLTGIYTLDDFLATKKDPKLVVFQMGTEGTIKEFDYDVTGSYFNYSHIENSPMLIWSSNGNTLNTGNYIYDYDAFGLSGIISHSLGNKNIGIIGDWTYNYDSKDDAVMFRAVYGDLKVNKKGQWNANYSIGRIEPDAVLACMPNDEIFMGQTNIKGNVFSTNYAIDDNIVLNTEFVKAEDLFDNNKTNQKSWTMKLDINF